MEYEGISIPKGAALITNTWTINHDERNFVDPHVFDVSEIGYVSHGFYIGVSRY